MTSKTITIDYQEYLDLVKKAELANKEVTEGTTQFTLDVLFEVLKKVPEARRLDFALLQHHPIYFMSYSPVVDTNKNPLTIVKK